MTLSGIHVNYSLSEEMLRYSFPHSSHGDFVKFKNHAYLQLAQGLLEYGWLINLLLSASPVCDGSYFSPDRLGETVITNYASVRCGKEGYWNTFTPILFYDDILEYAGSIQRYLNSSTLAGVGELYYPIRLKPKGTNRLNNLVQNGVNHIELRNIDINPFAESGIDARDLQFIELLCLWIYTNYKLREEVVKSIQGESAFSQSMLAGLVEDSEKKCESLKAQCERAERDVESSKTLIKDLNDQYDEIISWSSLYDSAPIEAKKMIVNSIIKRVDVYRNYELNVELNMNIRQFFLGMEEIESIPITA